MSVEQGGNSVLDAFLQKTPDVIGSRLLTRPIRAGEILFEPGAPYIHAIFPHSGIISLQAALKDGRTVEKVMVGSKEFIGIEYVMGDTHLGCQGVVALSGRASWLPISDLNMILDQHEDIRLTIRHSGLTLLKALNQPTISACVHSSGQALPT